MGVSGAEEFPDVELSVLGVYREEDDFSTLEVFRGHADFSVGALLDDMEFSFETLLGDVGFSVLWGLREDVDF